MLALVLNTRKYSSQDVAYLSSFLVVNNVHSTRRFAICINLADIPSSQIMFMLGSSGCLCTRHDAVKRAKSAEVQAPAQRRNKSK